MTNSATDYDLVVVGAGPAGCAAAIAALRENPSARVLLLDRSDLGRDKVCGDGIAPHAVAALGRLGVAGVLPEETVPTVRLCAPHGTSAAAVTASPGFVVPRAVFDERLARSAIAAGAQFERRKVATVAQRDGSVLVDGVIRARAVVAADGSNSVVRRALGERGNRQASLAVAIRGYAATPVGAPAELAIRWDRIRAGGLCYAWAFPTSGGTTNVGYGMSSAGLTGGRAQLLGRMRALLPDYDLDGVRIVGHTLPLSISRPRPATGRVLLVGDAASLINPITGEGIYAAIASGALAGAAAIADPATAAARYRRRLAGLFGRQHTQLRALYPLINSRLVLDTVIRACRSDRRVFERVLEVGLADASFSPADVVRIVRLGRPQRGAVS